MQPRISVVIPTFQCGQYLKQCVDSALAQSYPHELLEIIVVDDGSTDDTVQIARAYGSRIRYIYQANRGLPAARNVGIGAANGDFIAFLDADDYWLPHRINRMVERLRGAKDKLVTTDLFISVNDRVSETAYLKEHGRIELFELDALAQLKRALEGNFIPSDMMLARSVLEHVGMFDESLRFGEDWEMWLRCLAAGYSVVLVNEPLCVYRSMRPGSITARKDLARFSDRVRVLERYPQHVSTWQLKMARGLFHQAAARECLASHNYARAANHLISIMLNVAFMKWWLGEKLWPSPRAASH